ncbi:proline-rich proteoglycan 2-like [Perognathus longimembris pacificus]|uniref:proline-rich proteoglycan 2-like n=1 Tax=Perognathus longimembris pacificus TaxID=214514 RepID=UPI0020186421|nr:proline-rich proteoglycan 2-like [Perognathus longimembris pacificus]
MGVARASHVGAVGRRGRGVGDAVRPPVTPSGQERSQEPFRLGCGRDVAVTDGKEPRARSELPGPGRRAGGGRWNRKRSSPRGGGCRGVPRRAPGLPPPRRPPLLLRGGSSPPASSSGRPPPAPAASGVGSPRAPDARGDLGELRSLSGLDPPSSDSPESPRCPRRPRALTPSTQPGKAAGRSPPSPRRTKPAPAAGPRRQSATLPPAPRLFVCTRGGRPAAVGISPRERAGGGPGPSSRFPGRPPLGLGSRSPRAAPARAPGASRASEPPPLPCHVSPQGRHPAPHQPGSPDLNSR